MGIIQDRLRKAGPERFGIAAVDCAKAPSKWMLCDFYGKLLVPPTEVEQARARMQLAVVQFREAYQKHVLRTDDHDLEAIFRAARQIPGQRSRPRYPSGVKDIFSSKTPLERSGRNGSRAKVVGLPAKSLWPMPPTHGGQEALVQSGGLAVRSFSAILGYDNCPRQ